MTAPATHRIEVATRPGQRDPVGESVRDRLHEDLGIHVDEVRLVDVYTIHADLDTDQLERVRDELFTDPITQESALDAPIAGPCDYLIEVGFLPGVTDNVGKSAREGIEDVLDRAFEEGEAVFKSTQYQTQRRYSCVELLIQFKLMNATRREKYVLYSQK